MVPSRVVGGMAQSSLSSGMYVQRDRPSEVAGSSQLNSFGLSANSIPGYARGNVGPHLGDVSNVANSGPSVGSLVTDANSGLPNGPHLRRSASANTEAYMRMPASPLSFSSNNISISGSSILDGASIMHQNSNQDPGSQQNQQTLQHQGLSSATSLPSSYMGQVQLPSGPKVPNSFMQDPTTISQLQKKPRLDIKQEDVVQQQVLQQLLQRQDSMHMRSPNPQLQALIQQQRLRQQQQQHQQQQQQQLLQSMLPMQRAQSLQQQQQQQQQLRQQFLQQGLQPSSGIKRPYDGGVCSRRLMQYLYHQRQRPADNTIAYWRKFVAEYYSPRAKKRWCLSLYDNVGHQSLGVFPQAAIDSWQCDICGSKSGKGFEATFEVLPRLNEFKYGGGIIDELLFLDLPRECRYPSGMMMLEYAKAVQESVYEHIRVVHEGQLRIIFTPDLKILHWEFCARRHEELLSRRLVAPQVNQLLQVALKCQSTISESGPDGVSQPDVQTNSAMVVTAGRQLARSLELQSLNDLGFPKRYVRCLQIAEVVNSMKDLMDFCKDQKVGSIEGLKSFPGNATGPKVQMQAQEIEKGGPQGLPADCNTPNQLTSMHPGITSPKNNNQHTVDRTGAFSGLAQPALVSSKYQNLPMRQSSMNATHNSVKQEQSSPFGTPNHPPTTPESSGILPGVLKNSQVGAFSSGQLQQHAPNGNGLSQQNQSLPSLGSQALQQQMVQQYLQDISNKNNGAAVPPQSLSVQNPGLDLKSSSATTAAGNGPANVAGHATNGSTGFKADSESLAPVGDIGFSQKTSDLSEDLHLSDDMVQDIVHEFTENGFFDNDLDDDMNFNWKA